MCVCVCVGGGDHLNSAIPQGDQRNFTHTVRGNTKNLQNLKNFQRPPPDKKNDTSLSRRPRETSQSLKALSGYSINYKIHNRPLIFK